MLRSLATKMGGVPFHHWFITISKSRNWSTNLVLFTWQKLAPIYLTIFQRKIKNFMIIMASSLIGSLLILNKKLIKEILAYSSIFNLRWIIMAISLNIKVFLGFTIIYWIVVILFLLITTKRNTKLIREIEKNLKGKETILFLISILGGIPPLIGFLTKWIVFSIALKIIIKTICTTMLILRILNLYTYMRTVSPVLIKRTTKMQKNTNNSSFNLTWLLVVLNTLMLIVCATW